MKRLRIYVRDRFTCQYCGKRRSADELTLDHITPRAQADGLHRKTSWRRASRATPQGNRTRSRRDAASDFAAQTSRRA